MTHSVVPMDTFKWIVTGLLGTLVVGVGWFLGDIRAHLREVHKEVTTIRIEAATVTARVDGLLEEVRRRPLR